MAVINNGSSGYPTEIDTSTDEVNNAKVGATVVDARTINGLLDASKKVQGELGVSPAGSKSTLVERLSMSQDSAGNNFGVRYASGFDSIQEAINDLPT